MADDATLKALRTTYKLINEKHDEMIEHINKKFKEQNDLIKDGFRSINNRLEITETLIGSVTTNEDFQRILKQNMEKTMKAEDKK